MHQFGRGVGFAGGRARRRDPVEDSDAVANDIKAAAAGCRYPRCTRFVCTASGSNYVPKPNSDFVDRIVEELMDRRLTKAERIQCLRELAKSGEEVPDELMEQALRKLMERITE